MDNLGNGGFIILETRLNLLSNVLVLVVPIDSALDITGFMDLANEKVTLIAIGDPASVSAGIYAEKLFELLGISDDLMNKLILASNVREVLTYVETGNVDAGIIFSSDALISGKVKVIDTAPEEINSQIVISVAVIKTSENGKNARDYLDFLSSEEAMVIFESYGFSPVIK
jgi:molybdate transport system substrate-binding protein